MSWLLRDNWIGSLLAFVLGAAITWYLLDRRPAPATHTPEQPTTTLRSTTPTRPAAPLPPAAPVPPAAPAASAPQAGPVPPVSSAQPVRAATTAEPAEGAEPAPAAQATEPAPSATAAAAPAAEAPAAQAAPPAEFSLLMDGEATLFDHLQAEADVPPGRYGEGSADAVPHQGPPDGFTIKGNAQSMLFHTPDSPYYGRTKPEVWFRTEADAERAGFTKYTRRPRKAADPRG